MSDKDETSQANEGEAVEQKQEAQRVDPAQAAGEAAARNYEPTQKPVEGKSYTKEEVDQMIESMTSKAVNAALEKQKSKFEEQVKAGDYMTRAEVEQLHAQERERAQAAVKAQEQFINEAAKLGVAPGSEAYEKLTKTFNDKLEAGAIQPGALHDVDMIRALAIASGAIEAGKKEETSYIDLTPNSRFAGMKKEDIPDYARVDLEMNEAIEKALRGG